MMSCWPGLEYYTEDRMCRDSRLNIPITLTWIGCIPPAPLQRYLCEAMGRGTGADGFMQRFQLVCYPDHQKIFILSDKVMPSAIETRIEGIIKQMETNFSGQPRLLSFNSEAQVYFDQWLKDNEILGYGSLLRKPESPFFADKNIPEINAIWIDEDHRRHGLGTALINGLGSPSFLSKTWIFN